MSATEQARQRILENGLHLESFKVDPLAQFSLWLEDADEAGILYPTAVSVATITDDDKPMQRFVILRKFDTKGFVFFTSLSSRNA
jgi:pyridoxamine 5'-phosphate oxidase